MPKGYRCDMCGEFHRHTLQATEVDFHTTAEASGYTDSAKAYLCKPCAYEVFDFIMGTDFSPEVTG